MSQLALTFALDDAAERDSEWTARARSYVLQLSPGTEFSSDALRSACGDPSGPGNAVGALVARLQNQRLIAFTGESVMSTRPSARGRWVRVWTRCDST